MSDQFGSYRINPAFDRHPEEAAIIGRILAGFGEIEFLVVRCAGHAVAMEDQMWRAFYRLRMTSARLELADAFMKPAYSLIGLRIEYDITYDMVIRCLAIRNQYAHCNWADHSAFLEAGLFFADIQDAAQSEEPIELSLAFRHIDVPLLEKQYRHFQTTMEWLMYLETEFANLKGRLSQHWPKPPILERPRLHNPPETHVPPWLTEDQKARHVARAQAASGGPPTPTPAQQALDRLRNEKRAKRQADRDRTTAQRSD